MERDDLIELARDLATPIPFDQLEAEGVLERAGAWWRVLDWDRVPRHARRQVVEMGTERDGGHVRVKFSRAHKSAAKALRRLTGDPPPRG